VLDPASRVVAGARIVLTNTETKQTHEVASDDAGQFILAELPTGRYAVEVRRPGFMTIKAEVVLAEEGGQEKFQLKLGSLQEMVTIKVSANPSGGADGAARPTVPSSSTRATPGAPAATPCVNPGATGGNIIPPRKTGDAKPVYPDHLRADKVAGSVTVEGLVGRDGAVHDLRVVETPHVDLGKAVVDAVGRWAFSPTLLNCAPVEVKITVIARFEY
jgi:TonB family protein